MFTELAQLPLFGDLQLIIEWHKYLCGLCETDCFASSNMWIPVQPLHKNAASDTTTLGLRGYEFTIGLSGYEITFGLRGYEFELDVWPSW